MESHGRAHQASEEKANRRHRRQIREIPRLLPLPHRSPLSRRICSGGQSPNQMDRRRDAGTWKRRRTPRRVRGDHRPRRIRGTRHRRHDSRGQVLPRDRHPLPRHMPWDANRRHRIRKKRRRPKGCQFARIRSEFFAQSHRFPARPKRRHRPRRDAPSRRLPLPSRGRDADPKPIRKRRDLREAPPPLRIQ